METSDSGKQVYCKLIVDIFFILIDKQNDP